jgi:hypothetical protein
MYGELKSDKFEVLAINMGEDEKKVEAFLKQIELSVPVLVDPGGRATLAFGVRSTPMHYFLNPEGRVIGFALGMRQWDNPSMMETLRALMDAF